MTDAPASPADAPSKAPAPTYAFAATKNGAQQYAVRSSLARRVLHVTNQGLTTADAQVDAQVAYDQAVATSPELTFEIVESFSAAQ